jgi:hypothetical protein
MTVPEHLSLFLFSLVVTAIIAYRLLRTRMGSALSQKLVSTTTATNSNTTVRFSGLEATATAAAATAAGGQQQADPAANSLSSQGRISNMEIIFLSMFNKMNIFFRRLKNQTRTGILRDGVHTEKVPCQYPYFLVGFGPSTCTDVFNFILGCFVQEKKNSLKIFAYFY